jgi:RNA polymerase sigma-70 factor (ECF subfamily)
MIEILNKALDKLPLKQREVFVYRHFDELTYEEISEITGKSVGGLKANYYHASNKIFEMMNYEK